MRFSRKSDFRSIIEHKIVKGENFYKYFFKELSPVMIRNSRHFLNFYDFRSTSSDKPKTFHIIKIHKMAGISKYYGTKLFKKVLLKNVHL